MWNMYAPYIHPYVTEFRETDIGSYEIIHLEDFKPLKLAKDCEHVNETYIKAGPFHCVKELP